MAEVVMTSEARKQANELQEPILTRIYNLVKRLEYWPQVSGVKALSGGLAGKYRLRTGDYRLQFRVETTRTIERAEAITHTRVIVEKIGHRDRFYEE